MLKMLTEIENIVKSINFVQNNSITDSEISSFIQLNNLNKEDIKKISMFSSLLRAKKENKIINFCISTSRIPQARYKTFSNFDYSILGEKGAAEIKSLETLYPIMNSTNLIFVGPEGTGKTHIAQAFGNACCQKGFKTFFIKMGELKDKFDKARETGKIANLLNYLIKPACLIIDEVGYCNFDTENSRLFFQVIDRRYESPNKCMILTSNSMPGKWKDLFQDTNTTLCALDRLCDKAKIFKFEGCSYRGKNCEKILIKNLNSKKVTTDINL